MHSPCVETESTISWWNTRRAEPYMPDLSTFIYLINLSTSHPTLLRMNKRVAEASLTNDGNIRAGKKWAPQIHVGLQHPAWSDTWSHLYHPPHHSHTAAILASILISLVKGSLQSLFSSLGKGNGNPLQYSWLENPVDRGSWWASVHRVAQSQTWLKWLGMSACIGEGNGNPLQYSCLKNPRDGGAWWAAVYGVAQSWTRLKQLSNSSILQPETLFSLDSHFISLICHLLRGTSRSPNLKIPLPHHPSLTLYPALIFLIAFLFLVSFMWEASWRQTLCLFCFLCLHWSLAYSRAKLHRS